MNNIGLKWCGKNYVTSLSKISELSWRESSSNKADHSKGKKDWSSGNEMPIFWLSSNKKKKITYLTSTKTQGTAD